MIEIFLSAQNFPLIIFVKLHITSACATGLSTGNSAYTNVIYIICQYFINLTVVYADGIKQIVQ